MERQSDTADNQSNTDLHVVAGRSRRTKPTSWPGTRRQEARTAGARPWRPTGRH